jgi:glyoxylase-like metal-dependent hydrolase (beta-lactamase superfamily II)
VPSLSRRRLLETAARGAAGVYLGMLGTRSFTALAQEGAQGLDLGNGCRVLRAGPMNVLAVTTGNGIALVDGGSAADSADLLRRAAVLASGGKIHTLFNTHWHPEQTGANAVLGEAGATIVAQENTKLWLTQDVTWPWNDETVRPLPNIARPNKTFFGEQELDLGGKTVQCGHLRDCPHTDGDIYVFFRDANVIAVGDAIYGPGAGWPAIDWWTGGWIGGIVGAIDAIFSVASADTAIVPARGAVMSRADLQTQYSMYSAIWERLVKTLYKGGGPKEALAANPTQEFNDIMGPSDAFVQRAFESLWAYLSPDA